ncbi:CpsD/CapB family tyrosine-protein kinase [Cohnella faecalis]|uniref:non-specific protein-tyrosine kinase n=1 Tax=Cohnella faecalis TaxID=2315694 RepID=A0A398CNA8_9BACL|nr:CpsD/CapB family tyrosine-protein kinase [Cohnella faecalis]RIE03792.1 polysaccharide biosynthesis tyrosine autokinase [Cohnella faecalis]
MSKSTAKPALLMELNPLSQISEIYHSLRSNIEFSTAKQEARVLALTSSHRGEGKTTTAVNLALAYSRSGKKVLLVDADLRNPSLHSILDQPRREGLSNYLLDQSAIWDVIKETSYPNLHVITSGALPANPTELLSSKNLSELFKELKGTFDRIIVDSPPLLSAADSQILASSTDGVVLVIEYAKTPRAQIQKAAKTLEHIGTPLLGTVINKSKRKI